MSGAVYMVFLGRTPVMEERTITIAAAQHDLRRAFVGGGPGAFISGLLWLTAAFLKTQRGIGWAFTVLFFGGMLIFPLSQLASRFLFRRGPATPGNPLGRVALESTIAMIGGLFAAWLFLSYKPDYVFPLSAIAVGTHYAAFRTVYGDSVFWVLGGLITAVGVLDILRYVNIPGGPILAVGLIEIIFAAILTVRAKRNL
ncbi:MAG: hypothetical protein ABI693_12805 [Bryobacteraceae bacterium]